MLEQAGWKSFVNKKELHVANHQTFREKVTIREMFHPKIYSYAVPV